MVVVGVFAEQQALLALLLLTEFVRVACKTCTVEVDGRQRAALGVVVIEFAAVWQAQAVELAAGVIGITQGAPALMLGDQAILLVVLEFQRMVVAIVDAGQSAQRVVAVLDLDAIGQGLG